MAGQEPRGVRGACLGSHPEQPGPLQRPGQPQVQGQRDAPGPHAVDPPAQQGRVEAQVADDVGGVPALVPHGLDGDVVLDPRVALRVAGDPGPRERGAHLREPFQQRQGAVELTGRGVGVTRRHEHVVHAAGGQPRHDVGQVGVIGHQPRRHVRDHPEPPAGQPLGQVERGLEPLGGRGGHGHRLVRGHPLRHGVLDAAGREHLEARVAQQRHDAGQAPAEQA